MSTAASPGALSRRSLADQLAEEIVELILREGLREGDSLPSTAELSQRYAVSRTVTREALAALAGRGILNCSQGRECVVATPGSGELTGLLDFRVRRDEVSLDDILNTRLALEVMAARLAALHASADDKAALRDRLTDLVEAKNDAAYHRADIELHRTIAEASRNKLFVLILDALVDFLKDVRVQATRARKARGESLGPFIDQHRHIIEAIEKGDPDAAAELMRVHLEKTRAELKPRRR